MPGSDASGAAGGPGRALVKRSLVVAGHRTSVSLEPEFWDALRDLAAADGISAAALVARIDARRLDVPGRNLSSAIRVYVLERLRRRDATS